MARVGHPQLIYDVLPLALGVHPLAFVDGDYPGVTVWQFASVIRGAKIGPGSSVGSCAIVDGARLGTGVRVGHGASIHPGVWIGDDVFVGPGAVICNDPWPKAGSGFDVDELLAGKVVVRIENGASIGAGSVILPGVTVGRGAMVAAGSVVTRDVLKGATWLQRR